MIKEVIVMFENIGRFDENTWGSVRVKIKVEFKVDSIYLNC